MEKNYEISELTRSDELINQKFANILFGDLSTDIVYKGKNEENYDIFDLVSNELPLRVYLLSNYRTNNKPNNRRGHGPRLEIVHLYVKVVDPKIGVEVYSNECTFNNYKKATRELKEDIYKNASKLFSKNAKELMGKFKGFTLEEDKRFENLYNNLELLFSEDSVELFKSENTTLCDFSFRKNVKTYSSAYRILLFTNYADDYVLKTEIFTSVKGIFTKMELTLYERDSNKVVGSKKLGFIPGHDNKVHIYEEIKNILN